MKASLISVICAVVLAGAVSAHGAVVIIDDFSDWATPVVAPATDFGGGWPNWVLDGAGNPVTYIETGLTNNVLGGTRESFTDGSVAAAYASYINLSPNGMEIANGSSRWSLNKFIYDAGGNGLNLDMTTGTKITVDMDADHLGFLKRSLLSVTLTDGQGNYDTVEKIWTSRIDPARQDYDFLLSDFTGLNLSDVDRIMVLFETDDSGDAILYSVTSDVPEPATMGLLAVGGLAMMRRRRRA